MRHVNLNWVHPRADDAGARAHVEALVVTEDDERHTVEVAADDVAAFVATTQASPVLLYDPENATHLACNLVGQWLPDDWTSLDRTPPDDADAPA